VSPDHPHALRYGIDRLVTNGRRVFGWGWVADPTRRVDAVTLWLRGDGWERRLRANFGLARGDVEKAFPELNNAASAGFVVTGYAGGSATRSLLLEVSFDDGSSTHVDVTGALEAQSAGRRKLRELVWIARAVARRLRRGDVAGIVSRARAQSYAAPSAESGHAIARIGAAIESGGAWSVVFDHNMGGGANQYRRTLVEERLAAGDSVLLCTYNLPTLDYRLQLSRPGAENETYRIASFEYLDPILGGKGVSELFVNSSVSFDEPLLFAEWVTQMRTAHRALRLTIAMHDYFAVCPSFVLLNADGRYCGIPDLSECAACLSRHTASYVALSPPTAIGPWRAGWGRCLQTADEVRCFSDSTRGLLLRAYPGLDSSRIRVIPHRVDYLPSRLPRLVHAAPLVIGIIGNISVQKGALVVREMLACLDREASEARIVVIGTLDQSVSSKRLRVTGPYRHEDLVDLIEANRINLFFFPSVCPETFSYVTEETIALQVPVVAFDLGAPGERLRDYEHARLCPEIGARSALATLAAFHEQLAAKELARE
jgi:glycosyltransferase involved in cell wall biosynthesis